MAVETVLVVNVGSSSVKAAVYRDGTETERHKLPLNDTVALSELVTRVRPDAVGHRLVHGGMKFTQPVRITPDVLAELDALVPLAPLHLPPELAVIRAVEQLLLGVPQVACFDTSFHAAMPPVETRYGIPAKYHDAGVRKYGFHGLSYQFIASQLPGISQRAATGKTVVCHLGSGASVCGMLAGKSVTTSMGFSPLDGLLMATRCGRIDPGVLLYLLKHDGMTVDQVEHLLERESGLLGVSGVSGDMQKLTIATPESVLAVSLFCRMAAKEIAAAVVVLGGLDALVFTAGIGENCPPVRAGIVNELAWLGVTFDPTANDRNAAAFHIPGSKIALLRIPTNEERVIAEDTATACGFTSGFPAPARAADGPLLAELARIDAYWRAANYLSVGQIYLLDNPLLREPLERKHVKPRLLGHWGTTPGLNFIYAHLNRVIKRDDLNVLYVCGPGHGGPGIVANVYLEGVYTEVYPEITRDAAGLRKLFKQFSFPGGIPSHVAPETPGSIHEGGELGYSLAHAFGAAFDNPDLIVACVVGDGEAETGPLATGWHGNKFLNPARDGAVLPVLHLNGYKIANPTVLAKLPHDELAALMRGYGYEPHFVEGSDPPVVHQRMAAVMDACAARIRDIWTQARSGGPVTRPLWPMIVLRTPKGWTCPHEIDGHVVEGSWRSHQVPMDNMDKPGHVAVLEGWMKSYRPEELFDAAGALRPELAALAPGGTKRMGANPHANGGQLMKPLVMPDFRQYAIAVDKPGAASAEATRVQGTFVRDVMKLNLPAANFRVFSPDENASNRWGDVFTVTDRCLVAPVEPNDTSVSPDGRVMEVLSEHQCQGWLEGYLLTGRHGFFNCYEAFIHIIDSMFNQHAKWLKVCNHIPWRRPIASLNYLLTSHVWRQDHNGFSHQDPGFLDHVVNKKAEIIRIYLPPDANTLLWVTDHVLRTWNRVNVVVAGKQKAPVWLTMDEAAKHCEAGLGVWEWAGTDGGATPDVVMACCGDVPTLETLAAVKLLREHLPAVRVRVVNVVNLMKLQDQREHPHGLTDAAFDALFGTDTPILFNFHGYPSLIHQLTYRRKCHPHLHVKGYKEEGTTTTPFDMCVLNDIDRFKLVMDAIDRVPGLATTAAAVRDRMLAKRAEHKAHIADHGDDLPEILDWKWLG